MSFLSQLFKFDKDEDDNEELEELEDEELEEDTDEEDEDLPDMYEGMTLDVLSKKGQQLLSGKLTSREKDVLTLERLPGCLAFDVLPVGKEVVFQGYRGTESQFTLDATVQESSRVVCKLFIVKRSKEDNQRLSFRLALDTPAWLYRADDVNYLQPEMCTLVDISTGGCCVESVHAHEEEEILRIKIQLGMYKDMKFLGQIVRASKCGEREYRYGILFAQLREEEVATLTRILYNIQIENRRD